MAGILKCVYVFIGADWVSTNVEIKPKALLVNEILY